MIIRTRYAIIVLGGVVGDFLGATICVVEIIVLICLR
jgi:cobalamin synthase